MHERAILRGSHSWPIHYFDSEGSGPVVFLLHGFPDSPYSLFDLATYLATLGYRCILPFLAGYHPAFDKTASSIFVHDFALDLLAILEHEDIAKASLIGSDWGAQTAILFAALHADRSDKVLLLGFSSASEDVRATYDYQKSIFHLPLLRDDFLRDLSIDECIRFFADWIADASHCLPRDHTIYRSLEKVFSKRHAIDNAALHYRTKAKLGMSERMTETELRSRLPIKVPVRALHGDLDRPGRLDAFNSSGTDAFLGPNAEKYVIRNAGHFPHLDQPQETLKHIVGFL